MKTGSLIKFLVLVTAKYRSLIFKCENESCLAEIDCGEAHLWTSYLERERLEKEHAFCKKGYLRLPNGKMGKIVSGPFGIFVYVSILNEKKTIKTVDPRLIRKFQILNKQTSDDYRYHRDTRSWMQYDVGWRCGYHKGFWYTYLWIREGTNPIPLLQKHLAKVTASREWYLAEWEKNRLLLKWQCANIKHPDYSLVASTHKQGEADGVIASICLSLKMLHVSKKQFCST